MSPTVVKLSYRAILNYMVGQNEDYKRLVNEAIKLNIETEQKVKCKYIKNGAKINAFINFKTGVITDEYGQVLRRGNTCCRL